ncbi:MAG: flagellar hook-basal body complex protein, partial [Chitinispirillia bacterium]
MLRSLYSSITGLRNHQVSMDVTANNIANVNTVGYKYGRVTFEEATAQLLKGSTRPTENKGGTNPLQIGLGMQIGSIDMILNQGNLQSTGIITDLAIEGRAFFAYSDGDAMFYSRNGALQMDASGRLVAPTNGFALQGMMANSDGTYPPGTPIDDISVPYGEKAPANATSEISYSSNLDSDSEGLGTVLHTNRFLAVGASTDLLTAMYDANGNDIGIRAGDILTFSCIDGNNPGTTLTSTPFSVTSTTTYSDLESALEVFLNANIPGAAGSADMSINATTGALQLDLSGIPAGNAVINNLTVRNDRPTSDPYVSNLFNWGPTVSSPTVQPSTGSVRAPVTTTDLVANIFDASGNALGFEDDGGMNDVITINGAIGGNPITPYTLTYSSATTTVGDLLTALQAAFNLPDTDGTYANNPSVAINQEGTGGD